MITFPDFDPVLVHFTENIGIRWYALAYIVPAFLSPLIIEWLNKGRDLLPQKIVGEHLSNYLLLGAVFGARLGEVVFYDPLHYIFYPLDIFKVWEGGMSFHGGLIGVACAVYVMSKKYKLDVARVLDLGSITAPLALAFGRLANFINAELYGVETTVSWCMVFPTDPEHLCRHPTQLYESLGEGFLLFAIMLVLFYNTRIVMIRYWLSCVFLINYSMIRFFIEFFKEPIKIVDFALFSLNIGQVLCCFQLLCGVLVGTYQFLAIKPIYPYEKN